MGGISSRRNRKHWHLHSTGFFIQLGPSGSTVLSAFLAIHLLLVVRYSWTELQMRKAEIAFFTINGGLPLIIDVWAAVASTGMANSVDIGFCWINVSPQECGPHYIEGH
jgi:hypothetical protein